MIHYTSVNKNSLSKDKELFTGKFNRYAYMRGLTGYNGLIKSKKHRSIHIFPFWF